MGFSTSTTHLIFFIASVVIASLLVGVLASAVYSIHGGIYARGKTLAKNLETDIEIVNDPNNVPNDNLTIYVKNTGRCQLNMNDTTVIVDGYCLERAEYSLTVLDNNQYWNISTVLKIEVLDPSDYDDLPPGDHYVKVSINGVDDTLRFRITT
jgi:flagellar protein FlaG